MSCPECGDIFSSHLTSGYKFCPWDGKELQQEYNSEQLYSIRMYSNFMLILFGVTNSEGVEHTIPIDVQKAGAFAYELENNHNCEWRIKDVIKE